MRTKVRLVVASAAIASLFAVASASSAGQTKLAGPIYKGAVPAVLADGVKVDDYYTATFDGVKALDCQATTESRDIAGHVISAKEAQKTGNFILGPWCFLTRDPIDKVKAFYDKAVGPMHAIKGSWGSPEGQAVQGYAVFTERAWFPGDAEVSSPGIRYTGISIHALPSPPVHGKEAKNTADTWEGQEAYKFYAQTRHFGRFVDAVDWFGDPTKRRPAELDALYKKYGHLEAALYQHKGPKVEPVDETLRARFDALQTQRMEKAQAGMIPSQEQIAQMQQAAQTPMPANQQATPEDAEFNAFMKRNPKVANRYVELTRQLNSLTMQGKFDEADAVDEKLQQLVDSNPELAALESRAEQRSAAASASGQARENNMMANFQKQQDQAVWGTGLEYLAAADKEDYYTLIVIDRAFRGDEKDYSRDRAVIDKETAGWAPHQQVWEFTYSEQQGASNANTAGSQIQQPEKTGSESVTEKAGDTLKKGLNVLKKFW